MRFVRSHIKRLVGLGALMIVIGTAQPMIAHAAVVDGDAVDQVAVACEGVAEAVDSVDEVVAEPEPADFSSTHEDPLASAGADADEGEAPFEEQAPAEEAPAVAQDEPSYEDSHVNMIRLYNPNSGEHFYTSDLHEAKTIASAGWRWEGVGWVAPLIGTPVYRVYNAAAGDHHYTTDENEFDTLVDLGWIDEGIGWHSDGDDQSGVLRQYNPNALAGSHNFTKSQDEDASLGDAGWNREGVAWYATNGPNLQMEGSWLVSSAWGSLERYWIGRDGSIARWRFVEADEGAGYAAYATGNGVVRGKWDDGAGHVYVADQEGRLASTGDGADGWIVTDVYDGVLQRYYYLAEARAMHSGFFFVDGAYYYGVANQGYVLRDQLIKDGAQWYKANSDGVLNETWSISGNEELDGHLFPLLESRGYDLHACYDYVRSPSRAYIRKYDYFEGIMSYEDSVREALDFFRVNGGNCYNYAAAMKWLAIGCGEDAQVRTGWVPSASRGRANHGWVEVYRDGRTYVIDAELPHQASLSSYNFFMLPYDRTPVVYTLT